MSEAEVDEPHRPESKTENKEVEQNETAIGIDLGTTYSCVAVWRNGAVEVIANDQGNRTTPSYVAFNKNERLVGEAAKNQAAGNSTNTIFDAKRLIGRKFQEPCVQADMKMWPFTVKDDGQGKTCVEIEYKGETRTFKPEEISAMVLGRMKETAEAFLGREIKRAVVTCPAYFNDSQRQSTKDAGTISGMEVMRIINEPTAAALAYGLNNMEDYKDQDERHVLIYDLGGGTFDVSILAIDEGVFEVMATGGDTHLGGEDFDSVVVKHLSDEFKRKHRKDLTENPRALRRLRSATERAKRTLSSSSRASIDIDSLFDGIDFTTTLTRARFEDLCGAYFRSTMEKVEEVMKQAGLSKDQIDEVVLVGGSTRIPKIQNLLREYFHGKEPCKSVNPDEAVAYGAAVQAAILTGQDKLKNVVLCDIIPLSLGIETAGGVMTPVLRKGSTVPAQRSQIFSTYADNQSAVEILVFEGERPMTKDNHKLGQFTLTGIDPAPRGTPQIEVTFNVDSNGIMNVRATDKGTKKSHEIQITNDQGRLSQEEIQRMVEEAERFKAEDEVKRKVLQARSSMEGMLFSCLDSISKKGDKANPEEGKLKDYMDAELRWLENHPDASLEEIQERHQSAEKMMKSVMENVCSSTDQTAGAGTQPDLDAMAKQAGLTPQQVQEMMSSMQGQQDHQDFSGQSQADSLD